MIAGRSTFPITELPELLLLGLGEAELGGSSGGFLVLLMLPLMLLSMTGGFVMFNVC